jgi:hypothetical protein
MADHRFAEAETWTELVAAHDRFVEDYNAQAHWAHRERADGRRSPSEVLGFLSGAGTTRKTSGAHSSPAGSRAPWTPSATPGSATGACTGRRRWRAGRRRCGSRPRLFGTTAIVAQPRLFGLDALGETGWLKALKLEGYAPRRPRGPMALQQALFPYAEAI